MGDAELTRGLLVTEVTDQTQPEDLLIDERHERHHCLDVLSCLVGYGGILWAQGAVEQFGIGVDTAAEILIVAGDNPERIRSEAAFAKLAGIAPVPTGSGMTSGKHRVNHGGHRQLNAAIYRTVIVRMRFHEPTIAYVARRTAEGRSKRDIIRCLKRYVIREVYHLVKANPTTGEIRS